MGRYILLNSENKVVQVRYGDSIRSDVGEIESETGEIRQIRQHDGTFIDPPNELEVLREQYTALIGVAGIEGNTAEVERLKAEYDQKVLEV